MQLLDVTWSRRQFHRALLTCLALGANPSLAGCAEAPLDMEATAGRWFEANNRFALSLLRQITSGEKGQNLFFSPFSIELALCMALEGARGETAIEMGKTLGLPQDLRRSADFPWDMAPVHAELAQLHSQLKPPEKESQTRQELVALRRQLAETNAEATALQRKQKFPEAVKKSQDAQRIVERIERLSGKVDQFELKWANSLWVDRSFPLAQAYRQTVEQHYQAAGVFASDFASRSDHERARINRWVADQTRNKIENIIPPGVIDSLTRLVIANAIYFKGTWQEPFEEQFTKEADFTTGQGRSVRKAMMHAMGFSVGRYAAFQADGQLFDTPREVESNFDEAAGYPGSDGFQVMELPYNGETLSMVAFLPRRSDGLPALIDSLTPERFSDCLRQTQPRNVRVTLPKFRLDSMINLKPLVASMGMQRALSPELANFSGLTDSRLPDHQLYITAILHKAFVDVNEKGTEAAAATIVAMAPRSAVIQKRPFVPAFVADHPFLLAIVHRSTGTILFLGKVEN